MVIIDEKENGKEIHTFYCDEEHCLRRAFVTAYWGDRYIKQKPRSLDGWTCIGPENPDSLSDLEHYCRKHPNESIT